MILADAYRSSLFAPSGLEIEMRKRYALAVYKIEKILIELLDIKTVYMLKVNLVRRGVLYAAYLGAITVIIVHRYHNGRYTA